MPDYRIEPCNESHYPQLMALYSAAYGSSMDLSSLRKKYDTAALGGGIISFVAIHRETERVVSHFGASPVTLKVGEELVLGAQSIDAATDAGHRQRGLFKLLGDYVHQACRERGVKLVFSQPNAASYHAFMKTFQFSLVDRIARWDLKLPVKTLPLFKIFHHRGRGSGLYTRYVLNRLKPYLVPDPLSFHCPLAAQNGRIWRDRHYLHYKSSPDKFFLKIKDVVFWIKLSDVLWIGDISDYEKVNQEVLRLLKWLAFQTGFNTISFHLNEKIEIPAFLQHFKRYKTEPSCFLYLDDRFRDENILLTGADFDTW